MSQQPGSVVSDSFRCLSCCCAVGLSDHGAIARLGPDRPHFALVTDNLIPPNTRKTLTMKAFKLADPERTTIVNALTVAARQYDRDAEQALDLALQMTIREPAEALAAQFRQHAVDA